MTIHHFLSAGERLQLEASTVVDQNMSTTNATIKRTASFVSLNLKDLPTPTNDQLVSTISGTIVSQTSIFKNLPTRRIQHMPRRQQQQQNKPLLSTESDRVLNTSPSNPSMPNLTELATHTSPLLILPSTANGNDLPMMDSPNKYSYETVIDSNGVNHHRLYTITDDFLRLFSKTETTGFRTSPGANVKMPSVIGNHSNNSNNNHNHSPTKKGLSSQKTTNHLIQQPSPPIDCVLRERSITIANENMHQPDAMERVNHILKQLYLPTEKTRRV